MRIISLRQATITLLASTSLIIPAAFAVDYTISTPTTVTNGEAANVLDGDDTLNVESAGSITTSTGLIHAIEGTGTLNIISNSGTLTTSGDGAFGVNLVNENNFSNLGTIFTSGDSSFGLLMYNDNTFNNSGTINTTGDSSSGAVLVNNNNFTNSGIINTTGDTAYGVRLRDNNSFTNSGTISVSGSGVGSSFSALRLYDNNNATNSGTITSLGDETDGVRLRDNNSFTNSGSISTAGFRSNGVDMKASNNFTNTGTINTTGAFSRGLLGLDNSIVSNSGTISTSGTASSGVYLDDNVNFTNAGIISTTGDAAWAVLLSEDGVFNNSGTITTAGENSYAVFFNANNVANNSGKVVSAQSYSFHLNSGGTTLNLLAPSFIGGEMYFADTSSVNITTGRSHSVLWDFSTGGPNMNFTGDVPWAWNTTTNQLATIDPTALSASANMVADLAGGVSEIVRNNSEGGEWWLKSFGGYSEYGASGIYNDYAGFNAGIVGGASSEIMNGFSLGAMLGYGISNLQVNSKWEISQTVKSKGIIGGIYGDVEMNGLRGSLALFGGGMANDSSRLVNDNLASMGIDHATANYNSWFISPELRLSADIASGGEWTLIPSAMLRYTHQSIDGYTEASSDANATMAARTVQMLEGNVELAAGYKFDGGTLSLAGGLDYRQAFGGNQAVTLIGQNITLTQNTANTTIGYVSANVSYELGGGANLDLSARAAFGTNNHKSIAGSVGISSKF